MTVDEKREAIRIWCDTRWHNGKTCDGCPLYDLWKKDKSRHCYESYTPNEMINENYNLLFPNEETVEIPIIVESDMVNHPPHYCREGGMESIDEMVLAFGKEAVKNFCLLNVWKYRYRAADKNGIEDLKKSDWYMNKYKELCNE